MLVTIIFTAVAILFLIVFVAVGSLEWLGKKIARSILIREFTWLHQLEIGMETAIKARQKYYCSRQRTSLKFHTLFKWLMLGLALLWIVASFWLGRSHPPGPVFLILHCALCLNALAFVLSGIISCVFAAGRQYFFQFEVIGQLNPPDGLAATPIRIRKPGDRLKPWMRE